MIINLKAFTIGIIGLLACSILAGKVQAKEASSKLVLILSYQEPGKALDIIRLTIENRAKQTIEVIVPPDIRRNRNSSSERCFLASPNVGVYFVCLAYKIYLQKPDGSIMMFDGSRHQQPAVMAPHFPKKTKLKPGHSRGALFNLGNLSTWQIRTAPQVSEPPRGGSMINHWKLVKKKRIKGHEGKFLLFAEYAPGYAGKKLVGSQNPIRSNILTLEKATAK